MTTTRPRRGGRVGERPAPSPATVLFDTNVLLDAVLARAAWVSDAVQLLAASVRGEIRGVVSVHALATVDSLTRKRIGVVASRAAIAELVTMVSIAELGSDDVRYALSLPVPDFEDALHIAAAWRAGASLIVTRDTGDFRHSPIPALAPGSALALLRAR